MNIARNELIIGSLIILILLNPSIVKNLIQKGPSPTDIALIKKYVVNVENGGSNIIVILTNTGSLDVKGNPIEFVEKTVISEASRVLREKNYTLVYISSPCIIDMECLNKYYEIGKLVLELKPKGIIFTSPSSGINTDTLGDIFREGDIPVYVYKTESALKYKVYTGPNNEGLGKALVEGLKDKVKERDKIVYIETVRLVNEDPLDNGYPRIDSARRHFNLLKTIEYKTLFTEWSKTKTYEEILKLLSKEPNIKYIVTPSIETAEGAILAVEALQLQSRVKVVSLDFTLRAATLIKEGRLEGTVSQELLRQGYTLASSIIEQDKEQKDGTKILLNSKYIDKNNLKEFELEGSYKW